MDKRETEIRELLHLLIELIDDLDEKSSFKSKKYCLLTSSITINGLMEQVLNGLDNKDELDSITMLYGSLKDVELGVDFEELIEGTVAYSDDKPTTGYEYQKHFGH